MKILVTMEKVVAKEREQELKLKKARKNEEFEKFKKIFMLNGVCFLLLN